MPSSPAIRKVSGLKAAVIHTGSSACTGRGRMATSTSTPAPLVRRTVPPFHSARTSSTPRRTASGRWWKFWGAKTKSFAFQPVAKDTPARPLERLSMTDHSSATRSGSCSGNTTLPARMDTRSVTMASAALVAVGLG
ncbi:hypothetical protein COSO111634_34450 [Corallococcus soli]